jgi:radical SAM-linked protein
MGTYRLRVFYEKKGCAVFISSRNLLKIIERILRRIDAPLKFTEGFSPHPKISFGHSLPLNISGLNESFDVSLCEKIAPETIVKKTEKILPEGIIFRSAQWIDKSTPSINSRETFAKYTLEVEKEINIEQLLKKVGKILKNNKDKVSLLIKINNFSHKELTGLLLDGTVKSIVREIL